MNLSVRSVASATRDAVQTQLWPLPTFAVIVAVVLGFVVPAIDDRVDADLSGWVNAVVFSGDASAARGVLAAVAGSLITVTSLTFSLTVVTLQLASSQFSPRLLRTFTQDLFVQVTLAIFLATFTFALTAFRSVRSAQESGTAFVPRLAVTASFVLAMASVIVLVLFLAHLTRQIRVETMLLRVRRDAAKTMSSNLHRRGEVSPPMPQAPAETAAVRARKPGFLTDVNTAALISAASKENAVVVLRCHVGSFVVQKTLLAEVWGSDGGPLEEAAVGRLTKAVDLSVRLGRERTASQDIGFGLRQLTDIANKALSPGINDPTTGVHAIGYSASLLVELADYDLGPLVLRGDDERARVILQRPEFDHFLDLAVAQPRSYGAADTNVLASLYELLADLASAAPDQYHPLIADQLRRTDDTVEGGDFDDVESARLQQLSKSTRDTLATT